MRLLYAVAYFCQLLERDICFALVYTLFIMKVISHYYNNHV